MKPKSRFTKKQQTFLRYMISRDPDTLTLSDAYCDLAMAHRALDRTGSRKGRRDCMRIIDLMEGVIERLKQARER